jgi:hypothetical protein
MMLARSPVLFVAVFLAACTRDGEPGACYRERDNACSEFGRPEGVAGKRTCTGFRWTPGEAACPPAGRLGTCTREGRVDLLYAGPPNHFTAAAAQAVCESGGGHFAAGGGASR